MASAGIALAKDSVVDRHGARAAGARSDHGAGRGDRRGRPLQRARGPDEDQRWTARSRRCWPRAGPSTPDGKTLHLQAEAGRQVPGRRGRSTSSDVKFSFERAKAAEDSTNKAKKAVFDNDQPRSTRPTRTTVIAHAQQRRRQLPLPHGREHGGHPRSEERGDDGDQAGRHRALQASSRGRRARRSRSTKWDGYRDAAQVKIKKATFRFINDPCGAGRGAARRRHRRHPALRRARRA